VGRGPGRQADAGREAGRRAARRSSRPPGRRPPPSRWPRRRPTRGRTPRPCRRRPARRTTPRRPGSRPRSTGKDLTGWKGLLDPKKKLDNPINRAKLSPDELKAAQAEADENMRAQLEVEDGALVFSGKGRSLATDKQYGDFEMWVDWKILEDGDSGIYLRGTPQVQIWDTNLKNGAHVGSGAFYNNQKNPSIPLKKADKPVGEWNTFFIRMVGEKATVYLNGELVTTT
jgi:hypothetical protein